MVMKDLDDYSAANVPREWHGWLHHINDEPGLPNARVPVYEDPSPTCALGKSSQGTYLPKGHWLQGARQRDWKKYTPWTPN